MAAFGTSAMVAAIAGLISPPAIGTSSYPTVPQITAIASAPRSQTLVIRGGRVEWLSLRPIRWTPVSFPAGAAPPLARGPMRPTAVAVTSSGIGLAGMSNGVVFEIAPGANHAADAFALLPESRVVALAGMGTLGHLKALVSTQRGTYSTGLAGSLAVWWPGKEAATVVAPANAQGTWAAIAGGQLRWAPATTGTHIGAPPGSAWTLASSRLLGIHTLMAERPGGTVAIATEGGAVLSGSPGEGLTTLLQTVATSPLGAAAKPVGLVASSFPTPGNLFVLAAVDEPLLVDGYAGWEALGGPPTNVHLLADVGGSVVEALAGGGLRVVAVNPALALAPPVGRSVPPWLASALGLAVFVVLVILAGFATWRLPRRPRVAVAAVAGVVLFGIGAVAAGRFVVPPAARYTWSQVNQAWLNGTYAASVASWLLTPSQCKVLAPAAGWKGPIPTTLTTTVAIDGPHQAVPTCELQARKSVAQSIAAMGRPLDKQLSLNTTSYFLYLNLGSNATAAVQISSRSACERLLGTCIATGNSGRWAAYYSVQLAFPKKAYSLWQKVMGWST